MAVSGIPKYQSISNDLRRRIDGGEINPGQRLTSQHALAQEYGVTVMTLRQALADLETEGLVHAVKGKGTFVSEPPSVRYDLDHLWSFTQEMTQQGVDVTTEVLAVHHDPDPADAEPARVALRLDDDAPMVEIVRRRSISAKPVVLQHSFLAESIWSEIATVDLATTSLYDVLAEACGLALDQASETLRAVALDTDDARLLAVEAGLPSLESIRVSTTKDGIPFLYDRALLSGTATEIRTERSAGGMRIGYQTR